MEISPKRVDHVQRTQVAAEISDQLRSHFGERVIAIGIYGSIARGADGPYSDIELHCVIDQIEKEYSLKWTNGDWRAEVGLYSVSDILNRAAEVNWRWPATHSAFASIQPLFDPTNLFIHVRKSALSQPEFKFRKGIKELIVSELYELIGKMRNTQETGALTSLPYFAVQVAWRGACLVGLENRYLYEASSQILADSLNLDYRPAGYDELCRLAMTGDLSQPEEIYSVCERFWGGVNAWAKERGIRLTDELRDLLESKR